MCGKVLQKKKLGKSKVGGWGDLLAAHRRFSFIPLKLRDLGCFFVCVQIRTNIKRIIAKKKTW